MSNSPISPRVPVLVVSGFLGSGKTTLVRWLLEDALANGIRLAVVSNEFGALGIDQALLGDLKADYVELAGGCVCCQLSDELLQTVQSLRQRANPERIVVETSGVALPSETLLTFWREPVRQWVEDDLGVVVVDAQQLEEGRDLEGTFEDQVTSADLLILNKLDLLSEGAAQRAEERLRALEPEAPIVGAIHCRVDPGLLFPPRPSRARRERPMLAPQRHDWHQDFRHREVVIPTGTPSSAITAMLRQLGALRIKGFVEAKEGVRIVQGVGSRIQLTAPTYAVDPELIGRVVVIERAASE